MADDIAATSSGNGGEKNLEILDPNDRLIELILDISNELDINVLCHKILLNVGYLTQADKCSLFLARGPRDKRYLEAKLFDVDANTSKLKFQIFISGCPQGCQGSHVGVKTHQE